MDREMAEYGIVESCIGVVKCSLHIFQELICLLKLQ